MKKLIYYSISLLLGLMLTLFACQKSEIEQVNSTPLEVDQITSTPLQLDQITNYLEYMKVDVSTMPSTEAGSRSNELVEASYIMPGENIAGASNGETFGISGAGDLTLNPKSVCGGGFWTHYDDNGNVIASGTWEAEQLMSFLDYGPSPAEGWEEFQFIHAGKSIKRIHLGEPANVDAILTVYCILPEVETPASWPEGIKINIQEGGPNFNQVLVGGTFFAVPWFPVCEG